jgi:hypothetical protein
MMPRFEVFVFLDSLKGLSAQPCRLPVSVNLRPKETLFERKTQTPQGNAEFSIS